ncbi:MAG: hypothetical protein WDA27_10675 [Actinomycetota bacterium]
MSSTEPDGHSNGHSATETRIRELEAALLRIPSITGARVVATPAGRIAEVHILSRRDRGPKQLVRDVQSVAVASFGIEIDYRTVSVVQLEDVAVESESEPAAPQVRGTRVELLGVAAETSGHATEITVRLRLGDHEEIGRARGPGSSGIRLVARAVVDAVGEFMGDSALDVDFADVVPAGLHSVAVSVLRLATPRGDQIVSGSAVVRKDAADAIARASLAALNRLV